MGDGGPVGQAVGPAGVGGDVAADGAGRLRRGIGGVVQPVFGSVGGELQVHDARPHPGRLRDRVDVLDLVQASEHHQHRRPGRDCPAGQAGPGSPGHDGHTVAVGDANDRSHLRSGVGVDDHLDRAGADPGITGVHPAFERIGLDPFRTKAVDQVIDQRHGPNLPGAHNRRSCEPVRRLSTAFPTGR